LKRTRTEITVDILDICQNGAIKTRIVYGSNLNFLTVRPYLDRLIKKGFLEVGEKKGLKTTYTTTAAGITAREALKLANSLVVE
jgi:predicted transcriptional regulator